MRLNKLLDLHLTRYLKVILGVSLLVVAIACGNAASDLLVTIPANSSATANASAASELPAPSVERPSTSSASEASAPEVNKPEVNIFAVPMVDTNKASVPLSDIVSIPLVAAWRVIYRLIKQMKSLSWTCAMPSRPSISRFTAQQMICPG
jgi:hypothetical protein